jgi:hypothetical protein
VHSSYSFMSSALDGGELSASRSGGVLPRGKDPRYPLDRRLGGPKAGVDTEAGGKILFLYRESKLDRPVVQSVARYCTD